MSTFQRAPELMVLYSRPKRISDAKRITNLLDLTSNLSWSSIVSSNRPANRTSKGKFILLQHQHRFPQSWNTNMMKCPSHQTLAWSLSVFSSSDSRMTDSPRCRTFTSSARKPSQSWHFCLPRWKSKSTRKRNKKQTKLERKTNV